MGSIYQVTDPVRCASGDTLPPRWRLGEGCQYFISQQLFGSAVPTGDKVLMTRFLADFCLFQAALPKKLSGVLNNFHCDIESVPSSTFFPLFDL